MRSQTLSVLLCVGLWLPGNSVGLRPPDAEAAEAKVQKLTFGSGGATRTYYLFIPEKAGSGPAPVVLLLHGSGHNGKSLVDPWTSIAKVWDAPSASAIGAPASGLGINLSRSGGGGGGSTRGGGVGSETRGFGGTTGVGSRSTRINK